MAVLVGAGERFELDVTIAAIDNNGVLQSRTKTFQFSDGVTTYADALAAAAAFLTLFDNVNEADIVKYSLRTVYEESSGPVTAIGNPYKEAILSLRLAGFADKKASHTIYSPNDAMVSGNDVVITAALQLYLDVFETGGDFVISDGEEISTDEDTRIAAKRLRTIARSLR